MVCAVEEGLMTGARGRVAKRPIGALVKARREALGMSQERLAALVGVTQTYISKIEVGKVKLPMRELVDRLAAALELPVSAIMEEAGVLEGVDERAASRRFYEPNDARADYTPAEVAAIVAYVESRPGPAYRERLAVQKAHRTPERYERLCVKLFEAWGVDADLALSAAESANG